VNRSIYPEFHAFEDFRNMETDRKAIRNTVKRALLLHNERLISINGLKAILELAMAWEVSTGFEEKVKEKEKSLLCKLR